MKIIIFTTLLALFGSTIFFFIDYKTSPIINSPSNDSIVINYNGVKVNAIIDWPESETRDILLAYHGTTMDDSKIVQATETLIKKTRDIITANNIMIIGVVYPEEELLMGDNIKEAEAALLWTKNKASEELGIKINNIDLIGHSQGGYLVTRLNTLHETDGVIANGPGPIDLSFRCKLEETDKIQERETCELLYNEYGSALSNPKPYEERSMINFSSEYKSKILFIQGMEDAKIQTTLWLKFKERLNECTDCVNYKFLEVENSGHGAAFEDPEAIEVINNFLLN